MDICVCVYTYSIPWNASSIWRSDLLKNSHFWQMRKVSASLCSLLQNRKYLFLATQTNREAFQFSLPDPLGAALADELCRDANDSDGSKGGRTSVTGTAIPTVA